MSAHHLGGKEQAHGHQVGHSRQVRPGPVLRADGAMAMVATVVVNTASPSLIDHEIEHHHGCSQQVGGPPLMEQLRRSDREPLDPLQLCICQRGNR